MEGLCSHHAEGTQVLAFVLAEQSVRIILHYGDIVPLGDVHDGVHFAADTGIMDRQDRFGKGCDSGFQFGLV